MLKKDKKLSKSKGFTMVEMLVAIFVLLVGVIGGVSAIVKVISLTTASASKLTAAYLAQEGLELIRNIRDTNWLEARNAATDWDEGLTSNCAPPGCMIDYWMLNQNPTKPSLPAYDGRYLNVDPFSYYSYLVNQPTKFQRKIIIEKLSAPNDYYLTVTAEVRWTDRGVPYIVTAREQLYNWR